MQLQLPHTGWLNELRSEMWNGEKIIFFFHSSLLKFCVESTFFAFGQKTSGKFISEYTEVQFELKKQTAPALHCVILLHASSLDTWLRTRKPGARKVEAVSSVRLVLLFLPHYCAAWPLLGDKESERRNWVLSYQLMHWSSDPWWRQVVTCWPFCLRVFMDS